ncbi:MAG: flagellar filament capping protein FliD [Planctomycetes bacterium]|nr:flagellar filament capping protein FliD [Planctomycetota bacterium]
MSSAGISFGGLASGLDTRAIISALVSLEQRPIYQLEAKKTSYTKQKSLFGDLDGLLDKLSTAANALKTTGSFLSMGVASDNEDVLTAAATSSASPGTHDIEVISLARAKVSHTDGRATSTEPIGANSGEFTIEVNGVQRPIFVDTPTLESIAEAINAEGLDVRAEVVDTGAAVDPFQLVVRSTDTGTAGAFTISGVIGDPEFEAIFTELATPVTNEQAAEDAQIKLNGITITRSTNSISGAIAGVTLDLKSINTPDTVTITIAPDSEEVSAKIRTFVDAYNEVVDFVQNQNALGEDGTAKSDLFGDSTLRSIRSSLRHIVGGIVTTSGNDAYQMLAQIGIKSDTNGKLEFTQSKFEEALATDEQAVAAIFTDPTNGLAKLLEDQIDIYTDSVDGLIKTRQEGYDRLVKQTNDRIDQAERRLEQYEKALEAKYANLESLLSRLQGQGSSVGNIIQPVRNN